jgi:antitoxin ChpS
MSHHVVLRKVGGSVMVAIPPVLLDEMSLAAGREVALSVENGRLVLQSRTRYSLQQLLEQCDAQVPVTAEDRAWLDLPAAGAELP